MAAEKLNPDQKNIKPPEAAAPPRTSISPAPEPVKSPGEPPEHEQAVIFGMVEDAPAPASKVINLSGVKVVADVAAKPPEVVPDQKRRGRPLKEQAGVSAEKKEKATEHRTGRPSKVDKAAREEAPPAVRDKVGLLTKPT